MPLISGLESDSFTIFQSHSLSVFPLRNPETMYFAIWAKKPENTWAGPLVDDLMVFLERIEYYSYDKIKAIYYMDKTIL